MTGSKVVPICEGPTSPMDVFLGDPREPTWCRLNGTIGVAREVRCLGRTWLAFREGKPNHKRRPEYLYPIDSIEILEPMTEQDALRG